MVIGLFCDTIKKILLFHLPAKEKRVVEDASLST